jgi:o-succinylbenzoate synthase
VKIERLILREVSMTLKEPFRISSGVQSKRRILLVELIEAGGARSWGESVAGEWPNFNPETVDTAWLAIREWVAPRLLGRLLDGPEEIQPLLDRDIRGHQMAKASVEMAAWGLAAEMEGVALARLLGRSAHAGAMDGGGAGPLGSEGVRPRLAVGISIGIQESREALVEKARRAIARGYRKLKIKIEPGADLPYVTAVREALGDEAPLMADANNAYTLEDTAAISALEALDALGLLMIEQPLAWDDLLRHADLQKRLKTSICLDESITCVERAADMIALGSGRIVNVKPGRVGGFRQAIAIHDVCAAAGIPVWCGGMLESGVGRAHNVALASLPNFQFPGDISPSERYWDRDIVSPEWTMDGEGWIEVPLERPGLGVEIDLERIEALTVRKEELRAA